MTKTRGRNKKETEEMRGSEEEGEDGRPCIKWRQKKTVSGIRGKMKRMEKEPKGI